VFDGFDNFYVKNPVRSEPLSWRIVAFLGPWHMPLLFLLAGAATWFALDRRSAGTYAAERVKRLLIPFVFGILVIVPPQALLARWFRGGEFSLAEYWTFKGNLSGYTGNWTPAHLWFIAFLFVFSLVALPLFIRWHRHPLHARWLLFAMPLVLVIANEPGRSARAVLRTLPSAATSRPCPPRRRLMLSNPHRGHEHDPSSQRGAPQLRSCFRR
jgi:hypothetical protein